jgi:hypothetical protein
MFVNTFFLPSLFPGGRKGGVKPKRIQLSRKKGWRMPPNTVNVSRPSRYGNPFRVGLEVATAKEACREYLVFLAGGSKYNHLRDRVGDVRNLKGKNLACWCKIGAPCHGDLLLELANK